MKKTLMITALIVLLPLATAANADPAIEDFTVSDETPTVGDTVDIDVFATDDTEVISVAANWDGTWNDQGCYDAPTYECSESWSFEADEEGQQTVRVRATDNNGESVEEQMTIDVQSPQTCGVDSGNVGSLSFDDNTIEEGGSTEARITVDNDGDSQEVKVKFYADGDFLGSESETIHEDDSHQFSATIESSDDEGNDNEIDVDAEVRTVDGPCGDGEVETRTNILDIGTDNDDTGDLRVTVKDDGNDRLEDAEVTVENGDTREKDTNSNGVANFNNLDTGDYDITATCKGHSVDRNNYDVDEGDNSVTLTFDEDFSNHDCDQNEDQALDASFTVSDSNPKTGEQVEFDASASTGDIEDYRWFFDDGETGSGEEATHTYTESGTYQARLVVDDGDSTDSTSRTINVDVNQNECAVAVSSLRLDPDEIFSGETSEASIVVSNIGEHDQDTNVEISVDNQIFEEWNQEIDSGDSQRFETSVSSTDSYNSEVIEANIETESDNCAKQVFDRNADLIVFDEDDSDDDETNNEESAELEVNVRDEDGDDLDADVEVRNGDSESKNTGADGRSTFFLEPDNYEITVSKTGYRTENRDVELDAGDERSLTFVLEQTDEDDGELEVLVKDENGDEVEDARVRVRNGEVRTDYTDDDGRSVFHLHPDDYEIRVSKDNYRVEERDIEIEEGDETTEVFFLERDDEDTDDTDGLQITDVDYPGSVCRGGSFSADVTVDNLGGFHEVVTITGSGLGSVIIGQSFSLEEGDEKTVTHRFTNVEGSGTEEFEIQATNHDSDEVTRTIEVESCGVVVDDDDISTSEPSAITMDVSPRETVVGNTVMVKGYVDGVRGRTNVEILVDGQRKARVSTQPDGYYQVYIRPEQPGEQTVTVRASSRSVSRNINMIPTSNVEAVTAPERVFEGETFEVCADVSSQVEPKLFFTKDKRVLDTRYGKGNVCFERTAQDTGVHKYEIKSLTRGMESSGSVTVEVLETKNEVTSFPSQIATVEEEDGLVKVELYNTHSELKRYKLELKNLPSTWVGQSEKEVILSPGESRTAFFYLTPQEEGQYNPAVEVSSDGDLVFKDEIVVTTGGVKKPRRKSMLERLTAFLGF